MRGGHTNVSQHRCAARCLAHRCRYRLGWITGAPKLVHKVAQQIQAGTCGPCSMTQVVVSQLLEGWGWDGFEAFVRRQQVRRADPPSSPPGFGCGRCCICGR